MHMIGNLDGKCFVDNVGVRLRDDVLLIYIF